MATAGQPIDDDQPAEPTSPLADLPASVLAAANVSLTEPSDIQKRCYWAKATGQSIQQISKKLALSEQEVTDAILLVQIDNERFSAARAGVEARKLFFKMLPKMGLALDAALSATKLSGKKIIMIDKESGEEVTLEDTVERPDHDTRLRAIDTSRYILAVVQPKDPAVQITTNSQTNILNQSAPAAGQLGPGAPTSPEAVIRNIISQRQAALPAAVPVARSTVLEGEVMATDPDQPEGEYEDGDEPDDDDDDEEDELDDADDEEETK